MSSGSGSAGAALPALRPGHAAPPTLLATRDAIASAIAAGTWSTDPPPRQVTIGGVRSLQFGPLGFSSEAVILHLHGGAYRLGAPEVVAPFAASLAARTGVTVVCPAYRLAPENPFPAGLRDAWTVLRALADASQRLIVSGDSAGGGLAAALAAHAALAGPTLTGLVLLSPWLDLTVSAPSYRENAATDPLFSAAAAREAAMLYLQGMASDHPLASPLHGTAVGYPPTLISAGAGEVLVDDARRFHDLLHAAGVAAELVVVPEMEHVAVTRDLELPGAGATLDAIVDFVDTLLSIPG